MDVSRPEGRRWVSSAPAAAAGAGSATGQDAGAGEGHNAGLGVEDGLVGALNSASGGEEGRIGDVHGELGQGHAAQVLIGTGATAATTTAAAAAAMAAMTATARRHIDPSNENVVAFATAHFMSKEEGW